MNSKYIALVAVIGVFTMVFLPTAHAQSSKYRATADGVKMRYIGPGSGGSMFGMGFHPTTPDVMVFGGDMGACYRTENGGKSWDIIPGDSGDCPRATWNVRFHPKKHNVVWHLGSGVLKSTDEGKSWKNTHVPNGTYCALGLDPENENIAYVAEGQAARSVLGWTTGKLLKTINGGKSWQQLTLPGGTAKQGSYRNNFTNLIIDPDSEVIEGEGHARVYLFGRGGLFRSENAGKSWKDLSTPFAAGQVNDMVMVKDDGATSLFLSVAPGEGLEKGGVYRSTDKGETWSAANKGLSGVIKKLKKRHAKLKSNPKMSVFALLLAHSKANSKRLYVGCRNGIYRSDDGGQSWKEMAPAEGGAYIKDKNGTFMSVPKKGSHFETSIWGGIDHFNRFIIDPKNADRIAFSDNQDMYLSTNAGEMWDSVSMDYGEAFDQALYPDQRPNRYTHKVKSRGPQNLVCDKIIIDPFDPSTYYAACMDVSLQISRDGGEFWEHPIRGTPGRGHVWSVLADPGKKGRLFIAIGQLWDKVGGVYRSEDGGRHWKRIGLSGSDMGKLNVIALDLKSPVDKRVVYIGSAKNGIYKSVDGGDSWKNITAGFSGTQKNITHIELSPESSEIIYAGSVAGIFKSMDAGATWSQLAKGKFEKVENISISKADPSVLYLCAHMPGQNGSWGESGFWRSADGGKIFANITPSYFKYAGAIAVNPYDANYTYACNNKINVTEGKQKLKIVRSKDGGKTWENIGADMACNRACHLLIDQKDPRKFFVLTRFSIIEGRDEGAPVK